MTTLRTPSTPNTRRLRRLLLGGTAVLILIVAAFFGSARLRRLAFHLDLPAHLGADIAQTANGFTYSQSEQGHTLFTIHASHLIEYKRDEAELKDATITLYGPPGSNRSDRIAGADFFYNRKTGIVRAPGEVTIDFAPPDRPNTPGSPRAPQNVHVTTSGLTFNQATGEATSDERVDFSTARASGTSIGAQYTAKTGLLILDRQVALTVPPQPGSPPDAQPTLIHATHAQLLRDQHRALLDSPDTTSDGGRATSDHATIDFRPDGSAQHLLADGHVHLITPDGGEVHAATGNADLDPQSEPTLALLTGGVTYLDRGAGTPGSETTEASSAEATLHFAPAACAPGHTLSPHAAPSASAGRPGRSAAPPAKTRESLQHAQFRQAVHVLVTHAGLPNDPAGHSTRELHAPTLDVDFTPDLTGKAVAQRALGTGGAQVDLRDFPSLAAAPNPPRPRATAHSPSTEPHQSLTDTPGPHGTTVRGDTLLALLANGHQLRTLDGTGHTEVLDSAADGTLSTSTGDTLHATFMANPTHPETTVQASPKAGNTAAPGSGEGANQIETATQDGHVLLTQLPPPGTRNSDGTARAPMRATGEHAEYHSADQILHLTGTPHTPPHLWNDQTELTANRVDYHRDTGNAEAYGDVRATDDQKPASAAHPMPAAGASAASPRPGPSLGGDGPVHIIADRARMLHARNTSYFYAASGQLARIWQGADQVNAPVLILNRTDSTLDARATDELPNAAGGPAQPDGSTSVVHATLGSRASGDAPANTPSPSPKQPSSSAGTPTKASSHPRSPDTPSPATRVTSATLHYSDTLRRADLDGEVIAQQGLSTIHSDHAVVYLTPAVPNHPSQLDHIVSTSHVVLTQPGRRGVGEQLVYTAASERYLLTGTPWAPPRVNDREHGTTTGAALLFTNDANAEVQVLNQLPGEATSPHAPHTTTDTTSPH